MGAAERDIESVGLGPAHRREFVDGAVAILDAAGRVHRVIGWQLDHPPMELRGAA